MPNVPHSVKPRNPGALRDVHRVDPRVSARTAGLRYSTDSRPGLSRRRHGRGFSYRDAEGAVIRDRTTLARIRALAIPPAWTEVWICPEATGHVQATGRDARGRKQHHYHPLWTVHRDEAKYERLIAFAAVLPRIRARCDDDLARPGLGREKVIAAVVRLLELTLIRVGNDEYARLNRSFGLTTFKDRHARVTGTSIRFRFRGKSGRPHEVGLRDRRLATIVRRCQDLPGQELFQYLDDEGEPRDIGSHDVNEYLREASGTDVTAKDFRTWAGTVLAYRALRAIDPGEDDRPARRNVIEAVRVAADRLGNAPAVARRSYIHPAVLEAYLDGSIGDALLEATGERPSGSPMSDTAEEIEVVGILRQQLDAEARRSSGSRASGRRKAPPARGRRTAKGT
jgi:DNA topoisomerase-1